MRLVAGFTLASVLAAAAAAQPPVPPAGQPPAGVPAADPKLDGHLLQWEKRMTGVMNFRAEFSLNRKEAVFQQPREYTGEVLCMKPNLAILRLENTKNKVDYEAYVCNGKSVFEYNGLSKTITEIKLPANAGASDNLMLDFLAGMKAADAKKRFQIALFKEDPNYVYLDIKPLLGKDKTEFEQLRLALYGPGVQAPYVPYMPAQVLMVKPNGDSESWKFTKLETDLPGVQANMFQYREVPGFQFRQAPPPQPPGAAPPPKK